MLFILFNTFADIGRHFVFVQSHPSMRPTIQSSIHPDPSVRPSTYPSIHIAKAILFKNNCNAFDQILHNWIMILPRIINFGEKKGWILLIKPSIKASVRVYTHFQIMWDKADIFPLPHDHFHSPRNYVL